MIVTFNGSLGFFFSSLQNTTLPVWGKFGNVGNFYLKSIKT